MEILSKKYKIYKFNKNAKMVTFLKNFEFKNVNYSGQNKC